MDINTTKRTVIASVVAVIVALRILGIIAFANPVVDAIVAVIILVAMFFTWGYFSHYKNNDFTEEARRSTGRMWLEKEYRTGKITGENFFDEAEEIKD